ncbi:protein of unknown function [Xenorhabdus poinarii G6]|uniref:Uncharacterized protein n=2 Tax=Xenorhabdus poinarii TaxID=40577 RepID=A0A068R1M9_9GAMM|nr:protein of unknown function [Xenorhabdus poinarii G6]
MMFGLRVTGDDYIYQIDGVNCSYVLRAKERLFLRGGFADNTLAVKLGVSTPAKTPYVDGDLIFMKTEGDVNIVNNRFKDSIYQPPGDSSGYVTLYFFNSSEVVKSNSKIGLRVRGVNGNVIFDSGNEYLKIIHSEVGNNIIYDYSRQFNTDIAVNVSTICSRQCNEAEYYEYYESFFNCTNNHLRIKEMFSWGEDLPSIEGYTVGNSFILVADVSGL